MINYIWAGLLIIGIIVGIFTGNIEEVTQALFDGANSGVEISLGLIGVMAFWLGLMNVAEESGVVDKIANFVRPLLVKLFPDIPEDHPAMGAIVMNVAANMLGLGDAATPLGIRAMKELQELNEEKDTASNAMVTFLAINTSSVMLIPATTVAVLAAAGSKNPTEIIGPTLIATSLSTIAAVLAAKILEKKDKYNYKLASKKEEK